MGAKRTIPYLQKLKNVGQPIVAITAYDFTFARMIETTESESDTCCDLVLVGDSLSGVMQGQKIELYTSLEDVIYHTRCVSRGLQTPLLVADLPFMTYQVSSKKALLAAGRLIQEGHAEAVKLEGGREVARQIEKIVTAGIPVIAHLGLTPQSFHVMGGYKVQGRSGKAAEKLKEDALAVQEAGAGLVVLEGIPAELASEVTSSLSIPTIGIGAGNGCDGQILVLHDLLGLNMSGHVAKFVKQFANARALCQDAIAQYAKEVRSRDFPAAEHTYKASPGTAATPSKSAPAKLPVQQPLKAHGE
jgi:3-methyl-2-oxobutanoate hydroxymethyltransferase